MKTISIFLASSSELSDLRIAIGNAVREWSDELEPTGYRIRLNCWEDWYPEFAGVSKQTEYNDKLVKESNITVALFRNLCGEKTVEEIGVAKSAVGCGNVHIILLPPDGLTPELDVYMADETIVPVSCNDEYECMAEIRSILDSYIMSHPELPDSIQNKQVRNIYTTVPSDSADMSGQLGNMIRSVDYISEKLLNSRCRMLHKDMTSLTKSHYHIAVLKDSLADSDKMELMMACALCQPDDKGLKSIVYLRNGEGILDSNPEIKSLLNSNGIYFTTYDELHRVKYNLVMWLIQRHVISPDRETGFNVESGIVKILDYPLISASSLGLKGSDDTEKLADLLRMIGRRMLSPTSDTSFDPTNRLDIDAIRESRCKAETTIDAADAIKHDAVARLTELDRKIDSRLDHLLKKSAPDKSDIKEISDLYIQKSEIERQLLDNGATSPRKVLATMMEVVKCHDSNPEIFLTTGFDVDNHYYEIASLADRYSIIDPKVEMMRMNYANHLSRSNRHAEALKTYHTAINNIRELDDDSELLHSYISHLFLIYARSLGELGEVEESIKIYRELDEKITRWDYSTDAMSNMTFDRMRVWDGLLCIRPLIPGFRSLHENALRLYYSLMEKLPEVNYRIWDEIYCTFPCTVATGLLDSLLPGDNAEARISEAEKIYHDTLQRLQCSRMSTFYKDYMSGTLLHNLAFAAKLRGNLPECRKWCGKALTYRRKCYAVSGQAQSRNPIAETLLLMGATYLYPRKPIAPAFLKEPLGYAEECLTIYTELNSDNYLEQVTDIYKALLLKGSLLMLSTRGADRLEGLKLVISCKRWNDQNPANSYSDVINSEYRRLIESLY